MEYFDLARGRAGRSLGAAEARCALQSSGTSAGCCPSVSVRREATACRCSARRRPAGFFPKACADCYTIRRTDLFLFRKFYYLCSRIDRKIDEHIIKRKNNSLYLSSNLGPSSEVVLVWYNGCHSLLCSALSRGGTDRGAGQLPY